jgi:DNA invertase Pin-like site-specific DNA recombinase
MIHILAAFAEHERSMISERTKAALLAAKSRGVRLGANGVVLAAASKAAALEYAEGLRSVVQSAQLRGARTLEDFSPRAQQGRGSYTTGAALVSFHRAPAAAQVGTHIIAHLRSLLPVLPSESSA